MLKAVFLDWYGTLSCSRFFEHWSAEGHPHRPTFARQQAWWYSPESRAFLDGWLTGIHTADDFVRLMADLLDLSLDIVRRELTAGFDAWTLLEPQTVDLVATLRGRGVRVVLATDNVDACIEGALPVLGLEGVFDAILSSHALGVCKGDRDDQGRSRFFAPYLEATGIGPGESVLIDDSPSIRDAVEAAGVRFLHAPHGTGPGDHLRRLIEGLPSSDRHRP